MLATVPRPGLAPARTNGVLVLVRRVMGVLALALTTGWLTAPAAAPAAAEAALLRHGSVGHESREAPRELYLVVGSPAVDHFTLRVAAGDGAAGHRVVLQRWRPDGWANVAARRFSPAGKARWQVPAPERRTTYRAVARVDGVRMVSTSVHFS